MIQYIHQIELSWLQSLIPFKNIYLDFFFLGWNFVDSLLFALLLIVAVWVGISWKWGARLLYLLVIDSLINASLKAAFGLPRPCQLDPEVGVICLGSPGFPSGAAQISILFPALLIYTWKSKWSWPIGIAIWFCISFSRLYLGVHFPTDLVGGWIVGLIVLALFLLLYQKIEVFLTHTSFFNRILLALGTPALYLFYPDTARAVGNFKLLFSTGLGCILSEVFYAHLPNATRIGEAIGRMLYALAGVAILFFLLPKETNLIALPLWFSFFASWLFLMAKKMLKSENAL